MCLRESSRLLFEQSGDGYLQCLREPGQVDDAEVVPPLFDIGDVGSFDLRSMREILLGPSALSAKLADSLAKLLEEWVGRGHGRIVEPSFKLRPRQICHTPADCCVGRGSERSFAPDVPRSLRLPKCNIYMWASMPGVRLKRGLVRVLYARLSSAISIESKARVTTSADRCSAACGVQAIDC